MASIERTPDAIPKVLIEVIAKRAEFYRAMQRSFERI
jgi:hypothetical protein